jgi:FtsH-binding integral membrane protein
MTSPTAPTPHDPARARKFRQAAFVYLHVAILYEAAAYAMWRGGLLPTGRGPGWLWLVLGALVAGAIFLGLLRWQNVWFARVVWLIHGLRLPSLIGSAFISVAEGGLTRAFYITAIVVVTINLWMLARAAWDL